LLQQYHSIVRLAPFISDRIVRQGKRPFKWRLSHCCPSACVEEKDLLEEPSRMSSGKPSYR
jgi:hypothetical protein